MSDRYDLVVLGGGTAGLVSSVIAAGAGAKVALVEGERTGGDCLWTGCVPSKSLIAAARLAHQMRHASDLGLAATEPEVDFSRVMDRVHATITAIEPHDSPERLRGEGVEVIEARGRFLDPRTLEAGGRTLHFRAAIIATGSEPALPPLEGLDPGAALTTETLWELRELPGRLAVLGGGAIGCELGQAFSRLGSEVTIVERERRLLTVEEPSASALIEERFAGEGLRLRLGAEARRVRAAGGCAGEIEISAGGETEALSYDRLLVAVGRRPRSVGIGLEAAGVEVSEDGAVIVDERLRTSAPGIFAAGDVTALLPFTHVAAHHARTAVVNALFGARRKLDSAIPWVTFTDPEVARVGLTEAEARDHWGERAKVARSDYAELDRAITEGQAHGLALLVGDPRGRLVGATVAAPGGGEAIAELTARVRDAAKIDVLSTTVHAYPTLAEGPSRAADDYLRARYAKPAYARLSRLALRLRRLLSRG